MPTKKDKSKSQKSVSGEQLTVEAELLDPGIEAPVPGDSYVISLMLYEVLKVISGVYPHRLILVGHHVPDLNSLQFRVGVRHRLNLTQRFPEDATILNKFLGQIDNVGSFFCLSFEVLE